MGRRTIGVLAAVLCAALLAGCGAGGDGGGAEGATRTLQTDRGPIEVPAEPKRIVVLSGGLAGYLYALDAPVAAADTRVLGVTGTSGQFPPSWAKAATAQGTTPLPGGEQLSVEAVAAANPDLIIGGGQGLTAIQAQDAYDRLAEIAPTVLVPRSVLGWQDQLRAVADAAGRSAGVAPLLERFQQRQGEVRKSIEPPQGTTVYALSTPGEKIYLMPETAALPALARDLGIAPDAVMAKARNPRLASTGDIFEISPELLPQVADAPNMVVVSTGGPTSDRLKADPVWAQLPSFRAGNVIDLPAETYLPDLDGALLTLDLLAREFGPR